MTTETEAKTGPPGLLLPSALLLGRAPSARPWCYVDAGARKIQLLIGSELQQLQPLLSDTDECSMQGFTFALCSRYFHSGLQRGPSSSRATTSRSVWPSAGGLGAVALHGDRLVADLNRLTRKYRQPRSAYLPFLEAGHIIENMGLVDGPLSYRVTGELEAKGHLVVARLRGGTANCSNALAAPVAHRPGDGLPFVILAANPILGRLQDGSATELREEVFRDLSAQLSIGDIDQLLSDETLRLLARSGWYGAVATWLGVKSDAPSRIAPAEKAGSIPPLECLIRAGSLRRSVRRFKNGSPTIGVLERAVSWLGIDGLAVDAYLVLQGESRMHKWTSAGFSGPGQRLLQSSLAFDSWSGGVGSSSRVVLCPSESDDGEIGDSLVRLGRAAQRIALGAVHVGLGTCMLHAEDDAAANAELGAPGRRTPTYVIAVGEPA